MNIKNKFKNSIALSLALIFATNSISSPSFAQNNYAYNQAYFPIENCINMGNGLEAPVEGTWGYRFEERDFYEIKRKGFDSVRIPIAWSAHISNNAPYQIDPVFAARVKQIIDWGLEAGLNVIIDTHHFEELYQNPSQGAPKLYAIWSQISQTYQDYPPSLIFEIINEPKDNFSGNIVNVVQNRALGIIRQTNPTRTVILAGDKWGGIDGMDNLVLPNDPYIIATVHYYGPFEFTHQGAEWLGANAPPAGRDFPIAGDIAQLNNDISRIYEWRQRLGIPILLGEYGTDNAVPQHLRVRWTQTVTRGLKNAQIPTCFFNFAGGFASFDKRNRRWNEEIISALGLPQQSRSY